MKLSLLWLAMAANLTLPTGMASARPPRSERVMERMAERAYARQSIAEARATRAEARVAEIAPLVPVPPPPRPATVRRMARAGVPLMPPITAAPIADPRTPVAAAARPPMPSAQATAAPPTPASVAVRPSQPSPAASPIPASAEISPDGTRSVLATAEQPAAAAAARKPAGPPVTHPPIELLPTPQPQ